MRAADLNPLEPMCSPGKDHAYLICCHQGVACIMSDKHGFRFYQPISPGAAFHHAQTLCLEKPIPHQGFEVIPGIIIMSCTCFKLGFCPSTVQVVASYLISMVFEIRHPKSPGINTPIRTKPCLSNLLPPNSCGRPPKQQTF